MPDLADLFPGYASEWINTSAGRIFARVGGKGPPLLLLHGFSSDACDVASASRRNWRTSSR